MIENTQERKVDELVKYSNMGAEITLYYLIKVSGQEISQITMRRPTVGDLKTINNNTDSKIDEDIKLFSRLCTPKLSHLDLEELDALDFQVLGVVLQNFFKKPQAITKS